MAPSNHRAVGAFMERDPHARRRAAEADDALGYRLVERFRDVDTDYDESSRVAFVVNCLALADRAVELHGLSPSLCAGPSFGQMAAMAFTGVLAYPDLVRLTAELARREAAYFAAEERDLVTHFFFRTPPDELRRVLADLDDAEVWYDLSCLLGGGFYAITLACGHVGLLEDAVRAAGGVPLYSMRPPVHCRAFGALREEARALLAAAGPADPRIPWVSDQDGAVLETAEEVAALVADGFVRPVRWPDAVAAMRRRGVTEVWVPGPSNLFDRLSQGHFPTVRTVTPEDAVPARS
ncbi:hypothetical protein LG943_15205 [Streptomonospora sp. S1-112]|uniref:Malonyl-CoA-[acyl-carrier-protein] transacylase small domain-containing protein n=1 Tax=Streptomonospora mangrovi TaxID=2883123 RepID=A0A9X3NKY2_9ACTN|nr:hypothetical protein [Streptomonospora mangrovi]MDA0565654.1 hypothetical protein [Streptomonospora mangrovi]